MTASSMATVLLLSVLLAITDADAAERPASQGPYIGVDLGVSLPDDLTFGRINKGIGTNCDQWLSSRTFTNRAGNTITAPLPLGECSPRDAPKAVSHFDLGPGLLGGVHLGYAIDALRLEAEYFRREQSGDSVNVRNADPKQPEFGTRQQGVNDFRGDNFFANVYYDFRHALSPRLTPYLGGGLGLMRVTMHYRGTSIRTSDETTLINLGRNPEAAGRQSLANETLSDTLFGYQVLAGLDYAVSRQFSIGLKVRYADAFTNFEDGEFPWKPLRGHESTVGPPGTPGYHVPIRYRTDADNLSFWGISLNFKYFFD